MKSSPTPQELLNQIAQIQRMERGKLCVLRQGPDGPYYNCQSRENGKNFARYVPRDQLAAYQEAIAGYQTFQHLTQQYAQQLIDKTRAELAASKKRTALPAVPPGPRAGDPAVDGALSGWPSPRAGRAAVGRAGAHGVVQVG